LMPSHSVEKSEEAILIKKGYILFFSMA